MADLKAVSDSAKQSDTKSASRGAMNSPYFDLDASIKVADAIYTRGGGTASSDQLAAWLDYKSTRSGTFITRMSAANKHFGLIEQNGDQFTLSDRGRNVLAPVMPEDAINAKADAFLSVTLFAKVYEDHRGKALPPEVGLKNLFKNTYRILPDRVNQAVRVFLNSADQSGFFNEGRDRLIRPGKGTSSTPSGDSKKPDTSTQQDKPRFAGGGGDGGSIHPSIIGLLRDLPPPGTPWTIQKKKTFLAVFTAAIDWIYPTETEGDPPP